MKETPSSRLNQLIILLMGTVVLISISRAQYEVNTKEVLRMITIATQCAILIGVMAWIRLNNLTRDKKVYAGNPTKTGRFDMILLGSATMLQPNDPTQVPTTTVVLIIAMILFLFIVCPYLIGRVLSQPAWTEEEEAMGTELPQWETTDNWADLIPRNPAGEMDGSKGSGVAHKE
jgi:Na+/melibiose symporter-like transporter